MDAKEKTALWVVGGIAALVLLYVFIARRSVSQSPASAPETLNYTAYPAGGFSTAPNGLSLPSVSSNDGCGCGGCSGASTQIVPGIQSLIDYYTSRSKDVFNNYENSVYSSIPDTVTQYFNNPVGYQASVGAQSIFKSV
jgi:hypothetical protein